MIGPVLLPILLAPSLNTQLAKWKPVKMPFDAQALSSAERKLVDKLVGASQYMERIYWEHAPYGAIMVRVWIRAFESRLDDK